jgi:hypothetical protein
MPFVALLSGERINSLDISPGDWNALKQAHPDVAMPCCRREGTLATSKLGKPFFKHIRRGNCTSEPESEAHRECKAIIYTTARDMRFEADTEVAGDGWIADVLVSTSQITIAFEVQLAGQTAEKTAERSSRYRASDVMPVWLTKSSIVTELSSHVPAFLLDATDLANIRVRLPEVGFVPLGEAVRQILMGEIPLKVDLDAYVPPWYQAEDHDALALSGEGLKILGYIALGILGLISLVCFLDAHKPRR